MSPLDVDAELASVVKSIQQKLKIKRENVNTSG
jgi:hypothetical protein